MFGFAITSTRASATSSGVPSRWTGNRSFRRSSDTSAPSGSRSPVKRGSITPSSHNVRPTRRQFRSQCAPKRNQRSANDGLSEHPWEWGPDPGTCHCGDRTRRWHLRRRQLRSAEGCHHLRLEAGANHVHVELIESSDSIEPGAHQSSHQTRGASELHLVLLLRDRRGGYAIVTSVQGRA